MSLVLLALVIGGFRLMPHSSKSTSPSLSGTLKGVPLHVDKTAMQETAEGDLALLTSGNYTDFYAKFGFTDQMASSTDWQQFMTVMNVAQSSGGCAFTAQKTETRQGAGLDDQPNAVTTSGAVACKVGSYNLGLKYWGDGASPEKFTPEELTIDADASSALMTAVTKVTLAKLLVTAKGPDATAAPKTAEPQYVSDVPAELQKLGTGCTLTSTTPVKLDLKRLGHSPYLTATVSYTATCTSLNP